MLEKRHFAREESSVNMNIFVGLKDLRAQLLGLTMLDFFLSVTSIPRFGTYHVIHMQSTNMVKVRTAITRMQSITRFMIQNAFYLMKDGCKKCISVNGD